jgi:hypothetical protein
MTFLKQNLELLLEPLVFTRASCFETYKNMSYHHVPSPILILMTQEQIIFFFKKP